jgi:23S rRNA pseudoU1915 N3-methylase RlmH
MYLKNCAENLKNFTLEDFSKFFQVMANLQYVSGINSESFMGKHKEFISINEKMINYNSNKLNFNDDENLLLEENLDIDKIIIRKDIPLKNILKDKFHNLLNNLEDKNESSLLIFI